MSSPSGIREASVSNWWKWMQWHTAKRHMELMDFNVKDVWLPGSLINVTNTDPNLQRKDREKEGKKERKEELCRSRELISQYKT